MNRLALAAAGLALAATACGNTVTDAEARSVDVVMTDLRFDPAELEVTQGETVTFRFRNDGKVAHDAYVGDAAAQREHEREMRAEPGGHAHGEGGDAVTVQPGKTGALRHTFTEQGTFEVGCHQPGHYDAGMRLVVRVVPTR